MTDLQARLREAGRSLDAAAPDFDAAELVGGRAPDDGSQPWLSTASADPVDRHRAARPWVVLVGVAAAIVLVVSGIAVLRRGTSVVESGPAAPPSSLSGPTDVGRNPDEGAPGTVGPDVAGTALDVLTVRCEGDGTVLDGEVVRARPDGVHLRVHNPHPMAGIELSYGDPAWFGGMAGIPFGETEMTLPLRPGATTISCHQSGSTLPARPITVVDPEQGWVEPTVGCSAPRSWDDSGLAPPRSTPEDAVRMWDPVGTDTPLRTVRYPEARPGELVASTAEGDLSFLLYEADGRWTAEPSRYCTAGAPVVRIDDDPVVAWYDEAWLDRTTSELRELADGLDDPVAPGRDDLEHLCATLLTVQGRAGDPDVVLDDEDIQRQRDDLVRAIDPELAFGCFGDEPVLDPDALGRQADAVLPLLVALRDAIDERR